MSEVRYGRLFRVGRAVGIVLACFFCVSAGAVDTSQCGALACEAARASFNYQNQGPCDSQNVACSPCTDADPTPMPGGCSGVGGPNPNHNWKFSAAMKYGPEGVCGVGVGNTTSSSFPACNCAAQPTIPAGTAFGGGTSGHCVAGCSYKPTQPTVCVGAPDGNGASQVCDGDQRPTGANCDPLDPGNPQDPPSATACNANDPQDCLTPLVPPPPNIPQICGTRGGDSLGCVTPPACNSTSAGTLCAGNPPPTPPPPPPPDVTPPPDAGPPSASTCQGDDCGPIGITIYPPPGRPPSCPAGTHLDADGNCVSDVHSCPDGSAPVNGQCPAPPGNCPDGTHPGSDGKCPPAFRPCPDGSQPVHGYCAPVGGHCADGSLPDTLGHCPPEYAPCADGTQPVNGRCNPSQGLCPNGSVPVDGRCQVGSQCDPNTDPNHCEGANNNAGGGDTCDAAPYCSGDLIACAELTQQWRSRCATEHGFSQLTDTTGLETDMPDDSMPAGLIEDDGDIGSLLDMSGWVGSSSCPVFPTVAVMDVTLDLNNDAWCSTLQWLGNLVIAGAMLTSAKLLAA